MTRTIIFSAIVLLVSFGVFAQEQQNIPPEVVDKLARDLTKLQQDIQRAQEERPPQPKNQIVVPPQRVPADAITLNVIVATPPDKRDMTHQIVFPKNMTRDEAIDACAAELAAFLKHKFPDTVEIKARAATCIAPEEMGQPS